MTGLVLVSGLGSFRAVLLWLIWKWVLVAHWYIHDPKLPLDGRMYTLNAGRVLSTNVFQINLGELLFRATLKVRCS